jgi:membrane-associated phospholipid phosphatase
MEIAELIRDDAGAPVEQSHPGELRADVEPRADLGVWSKHGRMLGVIGAVVWLIWFAFVPSWPTPDKLFVLMLCGFAAVGAAREGVVKFAPFIALLLVYESFRGVADDLNSRVEFSGLIRADEMLFGGELPTIRLQNWFFDGEAGAFEVVMYGVYMLHFVVPFALAFLLWWRRPEYYWNYATSIVVTSFAGFATFVAFPAAPPWLARQQGYTDGFAHLSAEAWSHLGLRSVPTLYEQMSPNPVAAVPSLHAAYATLFAMFVFMAFGRRWGALSVIYPLAIYFSTVYLGEHYLIDEIIGSIYAVVGFFAARWIVAWVKASRDRRAARKLDGDTGARASIHGRANGDHNEAASAATVTEASPTIGSPWPTTSVSNRRAASTRTESSAAIMSEEN